MSNVATIKPTEVSPEVVQQKRTAWANMGELVYTSEMELQAEAQLALSKIKLPTTYEEVPAAEKTLAEVKKSKTVVEAKRKEITSKFDPAIERLMAPEKSFAVPIANLQGAIIQVKKIEEDRQKTIKAKDEQIKQCRFNLTTARSNADSQFRTFIIDKIKQAYEFALGEGKIQLHSLPAYISSVMLRFSEKIFTAPVPTKVYYPLLTDAEFTELLDECWNYDPKMYVADAERDLKNRFADYEVALTNKENALKFAEQQAAAATENVKTDEANKAVAAKMETISIDFSVQTTATKALKKSFEVDMPETVESAIAILTAFTANIQLCLAKLKVNKWFSFTPAQAATALAKVKNDDNAFQPSGIKFKEVDKL